MCLLGGLLDTLGTAKKQKDKTNKQINNIKQPIIEDQELDKKANKYQENGQIFEVPTKVQNTINSSPTSNKTKNQQKLLGLNLGG